MFPELTNLPNNQVSALLEKVVRTALINSNFSNSKFLQSKSNKRTIQIVSRYIFFIECDSQSQILNRFYVIITMG